MTRPSDTPGSPTSGKTATGASATPDRTPATEADAAGLPSPADPGAGRERGDAGLASTGESLNAGQAPQTRADADEGKPDAAGTREASGGSGP